MPGGADGPAAQQQPVFGHLQLHNLGVGLGWFNHLELDNNDATYETMELVRHYLETSIEACNDPRILNEYSSMDRADETRVIREKCEATIMERTQADPNFSGTPLYRHLDSAILLCDQLLGLLAAGADRRAGRR